MKNQIIFIQGDLLKSRNFVKVWATFLSPLLNDKALQLTGVEYRFENKELQQAAEAFKANLLAAEQELKEEFEKDGNLEYFCGLDSIRQSICF